MKIAVIGSRSFNNYDLLEQTLNQYSISLLVSGGANGADSLAQKYAKQYGKSILIHYPDWTYLGKKAGYVRNKKIIDDSEKVIAFWNGTSKGTLNSIEEAKKQGKNVVIIKYKEIGGW